MKNVESKRIDGCDVPCATAVLTPCVKKNTVAAIGVSISR